MGSLIRSATKRDFEKIGELLRYAHEESDNYRDESYSELRVYSMLGMFLADPKSMIFVDDNVDMVLIAEVSPDWKSLGFIAWTHLIYAKPGVNGTLLLNAFVTWAKSWNAVHKIGISTSFGGPRGEKTERLLGLLGFREVGKQLILEDF